MGPRCRPPPHTDDHDYVNIQDIQYISDLRTNTNIALDAEVEKLGSKWATKINHFSTDFCTKDTTFLTELSELPKNLNK